MGCPDGPKLMTGVLMEGKQEEKLIVDVMMEARDWIYSRKGPQVKECRWPLEAKKRQGNRFSPQSPQKESALPAP